MRCLYFTQGEVLWGHSPSGKVVIMQQDFYQGVGECPDDPGYEAAYRIHDGNLFCIGCGGNHEPATSSQREIRAGQ